MMATDASNMTYTPRIVIDRGTRVRRSSASTIGRSASAKNKLIASAAYAQDNQSTLARWFGAALATGLTVEQVQSWPDRIRQVTADSVRAAARRYLDKRRSVTGYLIRDTARPVEGKRT